MQYRCRLCGQTYGGGVTNEKSAQRFLIEAMMNGHSGCNNSIPLAMLEPHHHADGSCGIGDLIGYTVTQAQSDEHSGPAEKNQPKP